MRRRYALPLLVLSACTPPTVPRDFGRGVCPADGAQDSILLVDRGSDLRGKLEALAPKHAIAVRLDGCNLAVLAQCEVKTRYRYAALTPKRDRVRLRDEVELYANIPLSAALLSAKLKSAGELDVDLITVGRFDAERQTTTAADLSGECTGATHVITGITAGAMSFLAGAGTESSAGIGAAGASASTRGEVLSRDGDERACATARGADTAPPFGCGAVVRLDLVPLGVSAQPTPVCAAGARWNGVQCETAGAAACPAGEVMVQGACVGPGSCAAGWRFDTAKGCVQQPAGAPTPTAGSMVRVPGATFMMGWRDTSSSPQHRVTVATFEIDVTEVTVGAFKSCVEAGGCAEPIHGPSCDWGKAGLERHPMNCVDWAQARSYCAWAGKRLPTEAEWEYAAVGQSGWEHPWGNEAPAKDQSCQLTAGASITCPVGSFPRGASRFGVLDQHGNVNEWMADTFCYYEGSPNRPAGRYPGDPEGECRNEGKVLRTAARDRRRELPTRAEPDTGFRCARTP